MAAKQYRHGAHTAARAATAKPEPFALHIRHGRDIDASRERIARPIIAKPRNEADWR